MRILAISNLGPTSQNPWGGVFIPLRLMGLVRAGNEVTLVLPLVSTPLTPVVNSVRRLPRPSVLPAVVRNEGLPDSVRWQPVGLTAPEWTRWAGVLGSPEPLMRRLANDLIDALPTTDFDVVQAHGMYEYWAGGLAAEVAQELGIPFTVTLHGSDVNGLFPWRRPAFRRVASTAAGLFFVSEALRRKAQSMALVPGRSEVTPNGIDASVFDVAGRSTSEHLRILYVGSLEAVKGADRLPAVHEAVVALEPAAQLRVVGDGQLRTRLQDRLAPLGVDFLGHVPPQVVATQMRDADVIVLPSRSEGWPCVVLEAQACGARVVSTDVGGLREAIGPGGEWIPAAPFNPRAMALAVRNQWRRPDAEAIAGRAAKYDWTALGVRESARIRAWI